MLARLQTRRLNYTSGLSLITPGRGLTNEADDIMTNESLLADACVSNY